MKLRINSELIKETRKAKGFKSELSLAHVIGITPVYLNSILKGRQDCTRQIIEGICEHLGLQPGDFLRYG